MGCNLLKLNTPFKRLSWINKDSRLPLIQYHHCQFLKAVKKTVRSSLFWQTTLFTCQQCAAVVCTQMLSVCSFEMPLIPRAISVPQYNMDVWHSSHVSWLLACCWTPGLLPALHFTWPHFSSMTCHSGKGQFYGVIKKVYLRLWNCRSQDQTNCSLHSLVTVEGLFAQATYTLQSVQVTFAPQKTSWETRSVQVPREV